MALEQDAEQIERLALEPVGAGPNAGERWHDRKRIVLTISANAQTRIILYRQQLRDGGETFVPERFSRPMRPVETTRRRTFDAARESLRGNVRRVPLDLAVRQIVDAAHIDQQF